MEYQSALRMVGIRKKFPGVCALDDVTLEVKKGQIHAIVGENGAGKSTLMKILCGAYQKDAGEIWLYGNQVEIGSPLEAQKFGIATIYQEFNLASHLSASENVFIGREPAKTVFGFIEQNKIKNNAQSLFDQLGVVIDVDRKIHDLNVCEQQFTEIAKALSMQPKILIMDEPTSALPEKEINQLFKVMRRIQKESVTILYISHCLDEVFEIADTITVLRDGKHIVTKPKKEISRKEIIRSIVGVDIAKNRRIQTKSHAREAVLQVKNLNAGNRLKNISFDLYKGEILGIAGLLGAGRTELLNCIFGSLPKNSGAIIFGGDEKQIDKPIDAIRIGLGLVPEDRKLQGLFLGLSTRANISTSSLQKLVQWGVINKKREEKLAAEYIKSLSIKVNSQQQDVNNLSGGNQQKVLLSRWLALNPKVLLMDDPTRGIDVGARAAIHQLIFQLAEKGLGVIFVSSELSEIMDVSDRILVMARGEITGEFSHSEATKEKILYCATLAHAKRNSKSKSGNRKIEGKQYVEETKQ